MTINPSIRIYSNKKENGMTFKIKTGWHFELLTSETFLKALKIGIKLRMKMVKIA